MLHHEKMTLWQRFCAIIFRPFDKSRKSA
jgi:hypothetical protein